ncbi:hypothetical protein V1282_005390 [Nitrobacteraceae bacterium AZCC 2146]
MGSIAIVVSARHKGISDADLYWAIGGSSAAVTLSLIAYFWRDKL